MHFEIPRELLKTELHTLK